MLTGQKPFDGESYNQVLAKILQDPVTNPMDLNPHIPKTLEQVILKAIARPPEHRYQSAKEMQIALESIIADDHPCPTASKKINLEEDSTVGTWTQSSPFVKNTSPKVHIVQPDRNAPTDSITATAPAKKNRSAHSRKLWILGMLCLILIGVIWVIFPQFRPSSSAPIKKEIEEKAANVSADSKTSTATNAVKLDPVDKQTTVDTADKPIAPKTHSSSTTSTGDTEAAQPSEFPTETNKTATSNTPSKDAKNADKATKKNKRRKKNRNKKNKTETNLKHPIKGRFDTVFATEYE